MPARSAICPNCGAAIEFLWSGAVQTTCPACKSILVRHDEALEKVGEVGQVPPTTTCIQIGTEGRYKGLPFVVVGRIIYEHERGHWNEWHLRMQDDSSAWLSDAMLEYAITRVATPTQPLPNTDDVHLGDRIVHDGVSMRVASITQASYAGVEGELPFEYWDKEAVEFADLRGGSDRFATIDYSQSPPLLFTGEYESFDQLQLTNLRPLEEITGGASGTIRGFNCAACGAAIEALTGDLARTIACPACATTIDVKNLNLKILQKAEKEWKKWKPDIPLGREGTLDGMQWRNIGFQVRAIMVEEVEYSWYEYLLWNPYRGFRYLSEYQGHWNVISTLQSVPESTVGRSHGETGKPSGSIDYIAGGKTFKHFQTAMATTRHILGEFPWEIRRGDRIGVDDFVAPPLILSRETTDSESTWSSGTYTEPDRIWKAFKLTGSPKKRVGVFANQPNPRAGVRGAYGAIFGLLAVVLLGAMIMRLATADRTVAYTAAHAFNRFEGDTGAFVTPVFALGGHTSNVEVTIEAPVSNSWAYLTLALIDTLSGRAFELGREVSFYSGRDEDGAWTEGSQRDRAIIGAVPPGTYYLRVEPQVDARTSTLTYTIRVRRDVPRISYYLLGLVALFIPLAWVLIMYQSFETARWAESDHASTTLKELAEDL